MSRFSMFGHAGLLSLALLPLQLVRAADNVNLDRLPQSANTETIALATIFNFTNKVCLPSPAISAQGQQNKGLNNTGSNTGGCQRAAQLDFSTPKAGSNTYYRMQCVSQDNTEYCAHMYALYFMKDQPSPGTGHRNDWEWAMVWTARAAGGVPKITFGSHGYHKVANTLPVNEISFNADGHARFVYDQTGGTTHTMYFYPRSTNNFYNNKPVTPPIVDWYTMVGDPGVTTAKLQSMFNTYDYGKANCSFNDNNFVVNLNKARPERIPGTNKQWRAAIDASIAAGKPLTYNLATSANP